MGYTAKPNTDYVGNNGYFIPEDDWYLVEIIKATFNYSNQEKSAGSWNFQLKILDAKEQKGAIEKVFGYFLNLRESEAGYREVGAFINAIGFNEIVESFDDPAISKTFVGAVLNVLTHKNSYISKKDGKEKTIVAMKQYARVKEETMNKLGKTYITQLKFDGIPNQTKVEKEASFNDIPF